MPAVLMAFVPAAPVVIVGSTEVMVVVLLTTCFALPAVAVTIVVAIAIPVMVSVPAMVVAVMIADVFGTGMIPVTIVIFVVIGRSRDRQHGGRQRYSRGSYEETFHESPCHPKTSMRTSRFCV
ncbi:MAG TPA: hypothetical protein VFQ00_12965 [Terriglobales bacterium]|nr:hypothetical protein [Terriglobales bacterium]